jgi:uncharacterized protein YndB with AHSA1/START domain
MRQAHRASIKRHNQENDMRTDRASKLIAASRERVFDAFTQREAVLEWLPPKGAIGELDLFEPVAGGAFRMTLTFDEGKASPGKTSQNTDTVDGRFVELVQPERIVQDFDFVSDDIRFAGTMTMTWQLRAQEGGTLVEVAASNVPAGIPHDEHEQGMASSLSNLADYLEGRATS